MCEDTFYYPDLKNYSIPDPSNVDFTTASVGGFLVKCVPCPQAFTKSGAPCAQNQTACRVSPVQNSREGMCGRAR